MRRYGNPDGGIGSRELFDDDRVVDIAHATAPIFLGENHAKKTELSQLLDDLGWKLFLVVPLGRVGHDLLVRKLTDGPPQLYLLVAVFEIHIPSKLCAFLLL